MSQENERTVVLDDNDSVPSDFFDDFSNQDFMAGLDVVDAWDDEEPIGNKKADGAAPAASNEKKKKSETVKTSRRDKRRAERRRRSRSKSKKKDNAEHISKRDPEKAKRDIQKDKDNWTKNNAAKLISERLKVVETGLVPPGTEMEVDLQEFHTNVPVADLREKLRKKSPVKRSPSFDLSTRLTNRNRSGGHKSSPNKKRSRSNSKHRHSRKRTRSHSRHRSEADYYSSAKHFSSVSMHKAPSPFARSITPLRYNLSWRANAERYQRFSRSPDKRMRRFSNTRSPSPSISEREHWLRKREYYRNRNSPPSKENYIQRRKNAPKDFLEELADKLKYDEKKKKMLHQISQQLNDSSRPLEHPQNQVFLPNPRPVLIEQTRILPSNNFQQPPPIIEPPPQYDQAFFIGPSESFPSPTANHLPPVFPSNHLETNPTKNIAPPQQVLPVTMFGHQPPPTKSTKNKNLTPVKTNDMVFNHLTVPHVSQKEEETKTASKLLEAKNLSLSDFLSVSAKYNGNSKPVNIHKKVKVLAQCQDAIKSIGNTSKLSGRFFHKKNDNELDKQPLGKCISPLRKIPVVRFGFTTPGKHKEDKSLQTPLEKLLGSMGLDMKKSFEDDIIRSTSPLSTDSDIIEISTSVLPPPLPVLTQPIVTAPVPIARIRFQSKLSQTDVIKCEKCDKRNRIRYAQQGIQCNTTAVNSGTQVTDEDVIRFGIKLSETGVAKKSLAHLTPAQLLGKKEPSQKFSTHQLPMQQAPNIILEVHRNAARRPNLMDLPNEFSNRHIDRDVRSGFSRNPEYQENPVLFRQPRDMFDDHDRFQQHEINMRMQEDNFIMLQEQMMREAQRPFFEPPQHINQNYEPRPFY